MNLLVGLIIFLAAITVALIFIYVFTTPNHPKQKAAPIAPVPKLERKKTIAPPMFREEPDGSVRIPFEIPRNIVTIKIMAQESPDLVVRVIRAWLNEK